MLDTLKQLNEVKILTKNQQQTINGGIHICAIDGCPPGLICIRIGCVKL